MLMIDQNQCILRFFIGKGDGYVRGVGQDISPPPQFVSAGIFLFIIALQEFFKIIPTPQKFNGRPLADTDIAQHTPYQGFSVIGYIRTGTGVKQTEVDCERNYRWRFKQPLSVRTSLMICPADPNNDCKGD